MKISANGLSIEVDDQAWPTGRRCCSSRAWAAGGLADELVADRSGRGFRVVRF